MLLRRSLLGSVVVYCSLAKIDFQCANYLFRCRLHAKLEFFSPHVVFRKFQNTTCGCAKKVPDYGSVIVSIHNWRWSSFQL